MIIITAHDCDDLAKKQKGGGSLSNALERVKSPKKA